MCPRILVIDDDLATLALLHDILAPEGYRVACASTADAGLLAVRQECPALILLALRLETPDAGWQLLDGLRTEAATAALPIIVCSADCRALGERADELWSRRCTTLQKPFTLDRLLGHVARALAPPPRWPDRVVRPGGRVVVTAWGPPDRCEALSGLIGALGPLMPPPRGARPGGPGALAEPGALAATLTGAGLRVVEQGEVACPFVFPNAEVSWRANASAGPSQRAITHSGEPSVRAAFDGASRARMRPDGSIRYENVFLWAAGERP